MTEEQIADAIRFLVDHALEAYWQGHHLAAKMDLEALRHLADTIHKE